MIMSAWKWAADAAKGITTSERTAAARLKPLLFILMASCLFIGSINLLQVNFITAFGFMPKDRSIVSVFMHLFAVLFCHNINMREIMDFFQIGT